MSQADHKRLERYAKTCPSKFTTQTCKYNLYVHSPFSDAVTTLLQYTQSARLPHHTSHKVRNCGPLLTLSNDTRAFKHTKPSGDLPTTQYHHYDDLHHHRYYYYYHHQLYYYYYYYYHY